MPHDGRGARHQGGPGPILTPDGPWLLGLDIGTSTIKATLMGRDGRSHGVAFVPTPFLGGEMTVSDLRAAVRQICVELGGAASSVAAVGIAGMAESGAPLDREGHPQAPIIAWHDPRGSDVIDRLRRQLQPDLDRWIGQRLRTVSSVAKLGWLVDQGVGPVDCWLGVPELVLFTLTGRQATEFSLAARTGAYHVGERRYLSPVIEALGLAPGVFPAVEGAGRPMGRISAVGVAWSGLPLGIPVTLAGHDHLVGMVGSGARAEDLVNSVGTAEMIVAGGRPLPDLDRALSLRVAVTLMPAGAGWALLASAARSGIVLAAVAEALGASASELDALAVGPPAGAGAAEAGVGGLIEAAVSGRPLALPEASPGEVWNGVLDALVARTWDAVDRILEVAGPALPERLVIFGGGSGSRPWLEAKAAARPAMPVWRSTAAEAVARGAALYAGVAAGWWPSPGAGPHLDLERVRTT